VSSSVVEKLTKKGHTIVSDGRLEDVDLVLTSKAVRVSEHTPDDVVELAIEWAKTNKYPKKG